MRIPLVDPTWERRVYEFLTKGDRMRVRNPFDRRRGNGRADGAAEAPGFAHGGTVGLDFQSLSGPPPRSPEGLLSIAELNAMCRTAYGRGRQDEIEEAAERERVARLEEWENGHVRGESDGWAEACSVIEQQFGGRLDQLHEMGVERLRAIDRLREREGDHAVSESYAESRALRGLVELVGDLRSALIEQFPRRR